MYTIHIIWESGRVDNVTATSKNLTKVILDNLLTTFVGYNEVSVYKNNDIENAIFFILRGKVTKKCGNIYRELANLESEE